MAFQMGDSSAEDGGGMMSEINVTPLVDVMLVLLIIFMVTAPLLQQGMTVQLPTTRSSNMPGDETTMVITITADQKIFLLKTEVTREELGVKLSALAASNPNKEIFLRADRDVPYGQVVTVMGIVQQSGLSKLGVVTQPGEDEER